MVVDSSALVAVILVEPHAPRLTMALAGAERVRVSAGTYLELSIVMARRHGEAGVREVDRLLDRFTVSVEPVTTAQAHIARTAFVQFGKGRHRAGLNFGDCCTYALAEERGLPILCVGDDFRHTDLPVVPEV